MLLDNVTDKTNAGALELLPNYLFDDLVNSKRRYDLAINVLSMSEMADYQIEIYGRGLLRLLGSSGIRRLFGREGIFYEQNHSNRHVGMTYAFDTLTQVFPCFHDIDPQGAPLTQGHPRLWANHPLWDGASWKAHMPKLRPEASDK